MTERTFTAREVTDSIDLFDRDAFVDQISSLFWRDDLNSTVSLALGDVRPVEAKLGEEGGGEEAYIIFELRGECWRLDGYYSSWDGTDWEQGDVVPVKAETITKVIYVPDN